MLLVAPTLYAIPGQPGPAPKEAWLITVKNNWDITGALPENLLLIGLQGLANTEAPRVYIEYPVDWKFRDFNPLKDFYASRYLDEQPDLSAAVQGCPPRWRAVDSCRALSHGMNAQRSTLNF